MRGLWKNRGFGRVGALFVGVAALAVVGVLVSDNRQPARAELGNVAVTEASITDTKPADAKKMEQVEKKLDVGEWDVQVSLPSNLSDAYYEVSKSSHDPVTGEPNTMWLGLTSLDANGCDAKQFKDKAAGKPVGALIRVAPTEADPVTGELYTKKYPNGVMVGEYYYAYVPWKNKTCAAKATLDGIDSAFTEAVRGMSKASATRSQ